jgi:hypothetical protein
MRSQTCIQYFPNTVHDSLIDPYNVWIVNKFRLYTVLVSDLGIETHIVFQNYEHILYLSTYITERLAEK